MLTDFKIRIMNWKKDWQITQRSDYPELMLKKNKKLKGKYTNQRCFIIGNGPSIQKQNLSLLEKEFTITVNQLPRNPQFKDIKTNCHIWMDSCFFRVEENKADDAELIRVMREVSAYSDPIVFYESAALSCVKKLKLDQEQNIYFLVQNKTLDLKSGTIQEIHRGTPYFSTVIHTAICVAMYMGFSEIFLLGCDCTGMINMILSKENSEEAFQYGYQISENEKNRMRLAAKDRILKKEFYYQYLMFQNYEDLYRYAEKKNIKIFNATRGGVLDSIPRVDYESVLSCNKQDGGTDVCYGDYQR